MTFQSSTPVPTPDNSPESEPPGSNPSCVVDQDECELLVLYLLDRDLDEVLKILNSQPNNEMVISIANSMVNGKTVVEHARDMFSEFLTTTDVRDKKFKRENPGLLVEVIQFAAAGRYHRRAMATSG